MPTLGETTIIAMKQGREILFEKEDTGRERETEKEKRRAGKHATLSEQDELGYHVCCYIRKEDGENTSSFL